MSGEAAAKPATFLAYWPGGEAVLCCDEHAKKLIALGRFMGLLVPVMPYVGDELCTNCVNEAEKK